MAIKVIFLIAALVALSCAAPAENPKDLAPEKEDLQTAASHYGYGYGGLGHWGGHWGGHYGYPHYGYGWGWPNYGNFYGHGWPYYYGHQGYWW